MALFVESLQRTNSVAIGGTADMPRTRRARRSDAFDPTRTLRSLPGCDSIHALGLYDSHRLRSGEEPVGNGIQSDSHPENSRGNGMSLSGA
jgi:hypothetical protein